MCIKKIVNISIISILAFLFVAAALPKKVTVYLVGDSTMAPKKESKRPETGWGEILPQFFNDQIKFDNHARNGRSTRSFIREGRWKKVMDLVKPGDYVFIQFGHNDESKKKVERYTSPEDYRKNLIKFVKETRAKKAIPVLLTPVMRRRFDKNGKFYDTHGVYPDIVRDVAKEYDVTLIDHHRMSEKVLKKYGEEGTKALFLHLASGEYKNYPKGRTDDTHFSPKGARLMAKLVADYIRNAHLDLAKYLKKK